jgi:outer membrane receptor for ferrienterochelin and colicin
MNRPSRSTPRRPCPRSRRVLPSVLAAVFSGSVLAGCGGVRAPFATPRNQGDTPVSGRVVTQSEIRATGARNAMEALERGGTHLQIQRTSSSRLRITHRGVDSFVIQPDVLVVVDGARVAHPVSALQGIPTESIRYIQVLSGREAALFYGGEAGNGVVVVQTSARR